MKKYRAISAALLAISSILGMIRGYRMTKHPSINHIILPPFSEDLINDTIFSNYFVLGWIIFCLVGVFGTLTIIAMQYQFRYYPYLIIIESIFLFFFTLIHIIFTGFILLHVLVILFCIAILVLGILQTAKEFKNG